MFVNLLIFICNIGGICSILSNDACAHLIHSLVTVRLYYCDSILYGLPDNSLYRLQKIQNTTEIMLARLPRFSTYFGYIVCLALANN